MCECECLQTMQRVIRVVSLSLSLLLLLTALSLLFSLSSFASQRMRDARCHFVLFFIISRS